MFVPLKTKGHVLDDILPLDLRDGTVYPSLVAFSVQEYSIAFRKGICLPVHDVYNVYISTQNK